MYEGSGWTINSIVERQLVISEINSCEGCSYFPLPKELRNPIKGLVNMKNEGSECCGSSLVRYLNPVKKNPGKIRNVDKELEKQLEFKCIKFPAHKKDLLK